MKKITITKENKERVTKPKHKKVTPEKLFVCKHKWVENEYFKNGTTIRIVVPLKGKRYYETQFICYKCGGKKYEPIKLKIKQTKRKTK